jgi:methylaspartate ammonia-lyase
MTVEPYREREIDMVTKKLTYLREYLYQPSIHIDVFGLSALTLHMDYIET